MVIARCSPGRVVEPEMILVLVAGVTYIGMVMRYRPAETGSLPL